MPKVSVVITAHNYGRWLPQALDSALRQHYEDFEVVVVDDGSTDNTGEVLAAYEGNPRVKTLRLQGLGLAMAANRGIAASTGEYIVRLDADDYFDENLVLVEASYLDRNPDVGLVFCDYYTVDAHGQILTNVRRARVNDEVELLDRPALAAGAMYRRRCYDAIGGYNESLRYQEDYDFWIKFIERFEVRNVSLPLMYYRQHGSSMSSNFDARMRTRREVKKRFVEENRQKFDSRVLAVVPARADLLDGRKLALLPFHQTDLLGHAIARTKSVDFVDRVIVSTDDEEIAERARRAGADVPYIRGRATGHPAMPFDPVIRELLTWLEQRENYRPDIVTLIYPQSPFIEAPHIIEALDTLLLYETDSVIGVVEDLTYHWMPGRNGLTPVGYQRRVVRQDKDLIYKEAGGIYAFRPRPVLAGEELLGKTIGHIELAPFEALRIQSRFDYWLATTMAKDWNRWAAPLNGTAMTCGRDGGDQGARP